MAIAFQICFKYAITKVQVNSRDWNLKKHIGFRPMLLRKMYWDEIQDIEKKWNCNFSYCFM